MNEYVLRKVEGKPGEKAITENNERENVKKEVVKKNVTESCLEAMQTSPG